MAPEARGGTGGADETLANIDGAVEAAGDEQVSARDTEAANRRALSGQAAGDAALKAEAEEGRRRRG